MKYRGFTLIEILVVIAVIAIIATVVIVSLSGVRKNAGDKRRIADMDTIGRFLGSVAGQQLSLPSGIASEGDLQILVDAIESRSNINLFRQDPRDPSASGSESGYQYIYADGRIVVFANLVNTDTEATLSVTEPTPGGGSGVFAGAGVWASGFNGTNKYYQVSN